MSIQQLPHGVIKQISSAQVINSVSSAVKELMENALDAGATVIDIKLERNGLDKIEIRDNASGIGVADINFVCLPHCTSKIRSFDDLVDRLQSYGFRGEALHSLCAVSQLSITTKTEQDEVASTYIFDNNGTVRDIKSSHQMKGTVVTATNLFRNVPVRKQYYESTRKAAEELKRVEKVVKQLSIIHTKLRVTLAHNKCLIWHKTSVYNLRQSLMQIYPSAVLKNLKDGSVEMLIANRDCNLPVLLQPASEAVLLYINQRPVKDKRIEKVVFEEMSHLYASALPINKCPLTLLSLRLSPESLDVNLEPNKTKVFIKDHEQVLKNVREAIMRHFYQPTCTNETEMMLLNDQDLKNPAKKLKLQEDPNVDVFSDLDVSEMRNLIIEKAKVDGEMASHKLNDIKLSLLDQPEASLSDPEMEKFRHISGLKNYSELDMVSSSDSFAHSNGDIPDSISDVEKTEPLVKNDDLTASRRQRKIPRVDSSDSAPSSFICGDLIEECERVNVQQSFFSNEKASKRSFVEENDKPTFAFDPKTKDCNTESNESNHDKLFPIFSNEKNRTMETNVSKSIDDSITPSQWSRGHAVIADEPLEGGVMLLDNSKISDYASPKRNELDKETKRTCISNDDTECEGTNRRDISPTVRGQVSNFANVARQVRSETREKPTMSFGVVAKELASRWNELHDDKKKSLAQDSFKMKLKSIPDLKPKETFKKKTLALKISMIKILEESNIPGRICQRSKKNKIALVGPLETATKWLYVCNDDVSIVDVGHLQENVLLHRYMCNSSVPSKRLDEPIEISYEIVGEALWNFLLTLERISDNDDKSISIVSDNRITKNGFEIIVRKSDNSFKVLITEIAKGGGCDVIRDLVETLKLAAQFEELEQCRLETTKTMLLDKVMEVCEQKTVPKETTEIRMMLQYWMQCMLGKRICPHDEPISVNLHRLCDA